MHSDKQIKLYNVFPIIFFDKSLAEYLNKVSIAILNSKKNKYSTILSPIFLDKNSYINSVLNIFSKKHSIIFCCTDNLDSKIINHIKIIANIHGAKFYKIGSGSSVDFNTNGYKNIKLFQKNLADFLEKI